MEAIMRIADSPYHTCRVAMNLKSV
jgi:hypothetical protein